MRITSLLFVLLTQKRVSFASGPVFETNGILHGRRLTEKPIIYTFFNAVSNGLQSTGMSVDADDQLLQTWREEWSRVGWKPVILSMKTAKRHPDYVGINAMIDGPFADFDRYCFLRWLAFAAVGGGFAADYDTFPLNFIASSVPNGGRLTVHESSGDGGVPSLVSATADEYTRFAWSLARTIINRQNESHWSDMKALHEVYRISNGTAYLMENNVLNAILVLQGHGFNQSACNIVGGKYALHFSRLAMKNSKVKDGAGPQDRATIGSEWLEGWRIVCGKKSISVSTDDSPGMSNERIEYSSQGSPLPTTAEQNSLAPQSLGFQPTIYTFFTPVANKLHTGMSDEADDQLLQTWRTEWSRAGWKPGVLSLDHAERHPDFEAIRGMLDGPFGEYDRLCFLRWLAYAVVGGGFVADYDTLPLNFVSQTHPNGGKLTVYEQSRAGGVPSLVSASAEEYTRFAWSLAKTIASHRNESHWSDMKAMQHLYQTSNKTAYHMQGGVITAINVLNGQDFDRSTCGIVEGKYALHFSHYAIKFGQVPAGTSVKDRANIGKEWLAKWLKLCNSPDQTKAGSQPLLSGVVTTIVNATTEKAESNLFQVSVTVGEAVMAEAGVSSGTFTTPVVPVVVKGQPENPSNNLVLGVNPIKSEHEKPDVFQSQAESGKVDQVSFESGPQPLRNDDLPPVGTGMTSEKPASIQKPSPLPTGSAQQDHSNNILDPFLLPAGKAGHVDTTAQEIFHISTQRNLPTNEHVDPLIVQSTANIQGTPAVSEEVDSVHAAESREYAKERATSEWEQEELRNRNPDEKGRAGSMAERGNGLNEGMSLELSTDSGGDFDNTYSSGHELAARETGVSPGRPVIYTFVGQPDASALSQEVQAMIAVWLMSWYEIGWEPRVLWLNAAEKHAAFNGLRNVGQNIASKISPTFYLPWLAMANVGGGWLSDYDVMPLDKVPATTGHLPNGGALTIHEASEKGGVPSMLSGNAEEYLRLCNEIGASALSHGTDPFWSESYALQELFQSPTGPKYFMQHNVGWVEGLLPGRRIEQATCAKLDQKYAIHISSDFVSRTDTSNSGKYSDCRNWVLEWRRSCVGEGKIPTIA